MGLEGIAIKDSIVVLMAFDDDPEASQGDPKAVQRVLLKSTRHVLTTVVTTTVGFAPLLLDGNPLDGNPFWRPLAIAITGGIAEASLLALHFVPAVYVLVTRGRSEHAQGDRKPSSPRSLPATASS